MDEKKANIVEAVLFIAGRPLAIDEIKKISKLKKEEIRKAIEFLMERYTSTSITIKEAAPEVYEMHVRNEYLSYVESLLPEKDFSPGTLKTLAYIAYRSPVKQSEVVEVRGNRAYEQIDELIKRGFVTAKPKGHTKELRITKKLLKYFNVKSETELKRYFERLNLKVENLKEGEGEGTEEEMKKKVEDEELRDQE